MQMNHSVIDDHITWLKVLDGRDSDGAPERIEIPAAVIDALVAKGFVRRWRDGNLTLTLGGMREVAQY